MKVWIEILGKILGQKIVVALKAHHAPTVRWCNVNQWIKKGNLLLSEFMYPLSSSIFFFSFLGSFSLCFRKHLSLMAYWTIPVLDPTTFSTSSALPRPLSRESWSCNLVIQMFPTFTTSRFREILAAKVEICGREMAGNFGLKVPDFHVEFRDLLHAVNLRHGTHSFTSLLKEGVLRISSPWKTWRIRPGLNPSTCILKASTLPLDHRSTPRANRKMTQCQSMD
jgi:hypothetical protein